MQIERVQVEGLVHRQHYSQVIAATGGTMVFLAGQLAFGPDGSLVGSDLTTQTTQVMRNLQLALASVGGTFANLVKITTYVVNLRVEDGPVVAAARGPFFPDGEPPTSTLVGVTALAAPGCIVEVDGIAVVG